ALTGSRDHSARLWDVRDVRPVGPRLSHADAVRSVAFSPDGKTFVTVAGGLAQRWDVSTCRVLGPLFKHPASVTGAVCDAASGRLATAAEDGIARVWDVQHPVPKWLLPHAAALRAIAVSPDARRLLTGGDAGATLWDLPTGKRVAAALLPG